MSGTKQNSTGKILPSTQPDISPEIEATFLEIDKEKLRAKLKSLGATLLQPETLMRRAVFYTDDHSFARVRDEGNKITMSYKRLEAHTLSGMKEICLEISNYEDGVNLLCTLGIPIKAEQETLREEWRLNGVEIDIDTWPWLPTFVEIEGPTEAAAKEVANLLNLDMRKAIYGGVDEVYKLYYDVTSEEVNQEWREIKFDDGSVPAWLATRKFPTPRLP